MNKPKLTPRPLQTLKVAMPWRMLLVGKGVEVIITGDTADQVEQTTAHLLRVLQEERITVQELPKGASFEDLEAHKNKSLTD